MVSRTLRGLGRSARAEERAPLTSRSDLILTDLAVGPVVFFAALTVLAKLIECLVSFWIDPKPDHGGTEKRSVLS